jgi:hypothetical protein
MPKVGGKKFPYTTAGRSAAKRSKANPRGAPEAQATRREAVRAAERTSAAARKVPIGGPFRTMTRALKSAASKRRTKKMR